VRKVLIAEQEVPNGGAIAVAVDSATGGFSVLLTRIDGAVRAFHNECPHAGRRLDWAPGRFLIEGRSVICAAHGATFDIGSGACLGGPCRGTGLTPIAIAVEDGKVMIG